MLMQTSAEQVPSLHRVAPRYLKLVTSYIFFLAVHANICTDVVHAIGLALFVLTSISYAVALSTSLLESS